jgi:hypothetical protein
MSAMVKPMGTDRRRVFSVAFVLALAIGSTACGGEDRFQVTEGPPLGGPVGSGSCAFVAHFRGGSYEGRTVVVEPPIGESLGEAVLPPCDDTAADDPGDGERIPVKRVPGIDPGVAVVWEGRPSRLLIRAGVEPLPPELQRYFERPVCDPATEPIMLHGTWTGIVQPDETTELDLEPPYDLELSVLVASDRAYEGADLVVRVPQSAGRLISKKDVRTSLWKGGSIDVTARCDGPRFIAEAAETYPG